MAICCLRLYFREETKVKLYKRILLLLDRSDADKAILEHVLDLAEMHESHVFLCHIVHSHTLDQNRYLHGEAKRYLEKMKKTFESRGIAVDAIIGSGEPEKEILKELDKAEYDLIAMGTHGHSKFFDILYGSVSNCLKHSTSIPILLIKA